MLCHFLFIKKHHHLNDFSQGRSLSLYKKKTLHTNVVQQWYTPTNLLREWIRVPIRCWFDKTSNSELYVILNHITDFWAANFISRTHEKQNHKAQRSKQWRNVYLTFVWTLMHLTMITNGFLSWIAHRDWTHLSRFMRRMKSWLYEKHMISTNLK